MKAHGLVLGVAAMLLAPVAWGESRTVSVRDVTAVEDGEGSTRIFFRLGEVPFSQATLIQSAVLRLPFSGSPAARDIELRASPVAQAWSTPTFETPYDEGLSGRSDVSFRGGSGVATFDLTVALKEQLEEGTFADGFVLIANTETGRTSADLSRFGTLTGAQLSLKTTVLPSGKPSRDAPQGGRSKQAAHVGAAQGR